MPTVADYTVLRDNTFELEAGEAREMPDFLPPAGFVKGTNRAKLILAYKARPLSTPPFAADATLQIGLRFGITIEDIRLRTDTVHGLWETFSGLTVNETIPNVFTFECMSGRIRISDVVVWYQVRL